MNDSFIKMKSDEQVSKRKRSNSSTVDLHTALDTEIDAKAQIKSQELFVSVNECK